MTEIITFTQGGTILPMLDSALSLLVVLLPSLFGLGIEVVSENVRKNWMWRTAVVLFGVGLSALTWWQQSRALATAKTDREGAITETANRLAPQVAAETSARVTGTLNEQYNKLIGGLYKEIATLREKIDSQFGVSEKEVALRYAPSIDLVYAGDKLQVWNHGSTNIYLWGTRYDNGPRDIATQPYVINPGTYYYLLTERLNKSILERIGQNGEVRVPLELYVKSEDGKHYIIHSTLWEVVKDGQLTIHTQTHNYEKKDWSRLP